MGFFWQLNCIPIWNRTDYLHKNDFLLNNLLRLIYHKTQTLKQATNKCSDLDRELKKLWNVNVSVKEIVFGALGTTHESPEKGLKELEISWRIETIQTTALLKYLKITRSVSENWDG